MPVCTQCSSFCLVKDASCLSKKLSELGPTMQAPLPGFCGSNFCAFHLLATSKSHAPPLVNHWRLIAQGNYQRRNSARTRQRTASSSLRGIEAGRGLSLVPLRRLPKPSLPSLLHASSKPSQLALRLLTELLLAESHSAASPLDSTAEKARCLPRKRRWKRRSSWAGPETT